MTITKYFNFDNMKKEVNYELIIEPNVIYKYFLLDIYFI